MVMAPGHVQKLTDIQAALDPSRKTRAMNLSGIRLNAFKSWLK